MIVEVETVAQMCSHNGVAIGSERVNLAMRYTAQDPYACEFLFTDYGTDGCVSWKFARDLLAEGMDRDGTKPAGDMDVMVWRGLSPGRLWLRLSNEEDSVLFMLEREDVVRFVRRAYRLVPMGRESQHLDLDACVTALLESTL